MMTVTATPDLKPENALDNLLNNRDILTAIFDFLQVTSDMKSEERSETRKALIAAAKSCKAFAEPALDVLWQTLPSMLPLLRLLPSFVSCEDVHIINEVVVNDWQLYDIYAKRVRNLFFEDLPPSMTNIKISPFIYVQLMRMHPSKNLLPNLQAVEVLPNIKVDPTLLLQLPSTHMKSLTFNDDASNYPRQFIPTLLATLQVTSPAIQKLVLKGPSNVNLDAVSGLKLLHTLNLSFPSTYLFPSFIRALAGLEGLSVLKLHVGAATAVSPPVQRAVARKHDSSTMHTFPSLYYLGLTGHPSLIARVVDNIDVSNLFSFYAQEEENSDSTATTNSWQFILSRLISATHLKTIYIRQCKKRRWGHANYSLSSPILLQLLDLPYSRHLSTITIEHGAISINDAELTMLTTALKNLHKLELPVESYGECPTIAVIPHLAEACPRLETLKLPISRDVAGCVKFIKNFDYLPSQSAEEHPLKELVLSVSLYQEIQAKPEQMIVFAEFFHRLFPNLASMGDWLSVEAMVLALRRARKVGTTKVAMA